MLAGVVCATFVSYASAQGANIDNRINNLFGRVESQLKNIQNKTLSYNYNNRNNNYNNQNNQDYYADSNDSKTETVINKDGTVVLRGATVNSISGNTIYLNSTLGVAVLNWTGTVDSNSKYETKNGRAMNLGDISVGDKVTVKGVFVSGSALSMRINLVRDITKTGSSNPTPISNERQIFTGRLNSLSNTNLPASATVTIGNTNYVVNLSSSTILLNNAWVNIPLTNFQIGDNVRVFGYIPTGTNTINGLVMRDTSR